MGHVHEEQCREQDRQLYEGGEAREHPKGDAESAT
jgi:hypothetical protein